MKYIKILTVCAAICAVCNSNTANATLRENSVEAVNTKVSSKTISLQDKKASNVQVKQWPKGGLNIITDANGVTKDVILKDNVSKDKRSSKPQEKDKKADKKRRKHKKEQEKEQIKQEKTAPDKVRKSSKKTFANIELPDDYENISIFGDAEVDKSQAVALIKANNPQVRLSCSVEELVNLYWEEAGRENVRPDLALAQSLIETGYYRYGGDVKHHQNNFCGLGTTGGGVRGATFKTPQIGVRAHIQHLLAYTQKKRPQTAIVDPRYELAHNIRVERGVVDTWCGLNGTWAMGSSYCEKIMATYQKMLAQPITKLDNDNDKDTEKSKKKAKKRSMRERVEELLKERNR